MKPSEAESNNSKKYFYELLNIHYIINMGFSWSTSSDVSEESHVSILIRP